MIHSLVSWAFNLITHSSSANGDRLCRPRIVQVCTKTELHAADVNFLLLNDKSDTYVTQKYIYSGLNTLILNKLHILIDCKSQSTSPIYSCI